MAFALRNIDRETYNKLVVEECSPFEAAAKFRETLNLNLDHDLYEENSGHYLIAPLLSLCIHRHRGCSEEAFIEQFVAAGVGNKEQAASIAYILGISEGQTRLMSNRLSLEQVDSLLSLTG